MRAMKTAAGVAIMGATAIALACLGTIFIIPWLFTRRWRRQTHAATPQ